MAEKRKYDLHKSPRGVLIWPKLNVPDTKYKPDGEYKTSLRISVALFVSSGLKDLIDAEAEKAFTNATDDKGNAVSPATRAKIKAKGPSYPYGPAFDKDGNELEDQVDLKFAVGAGGVDRKTGETYSNKPKQFDAKGKPISVALNIGTEAKVSFTCFPWATAALGHGVALRPKAVQVLKLAERGGSDAGYYGFEEEEDGYEYSKDLDGGEGEFDSEAPADAGSDEDQIPF